MSSNPKRPNPGAIQPMRGQERILGNREVLDTTEEEQFMCESCRKINFEKVLQLDVATLQASESCNGIFIAELGPSFRNGDFSSLLHLYGKSEEYCAHKGHDLPTLALLKKGGSYLYSSPEEANTHLRQSGQILCHPKDIETQWPFNYPVVHPSINYETVAGWLKYCTSNHSRFCGKEDVESPWPIGLELIDCVSLKIRAASQSDPYMALSYVWGSQNSGLDPVLKVGRSRKLILERLPRVISDAIEVTQNLGIRYLWVDRFCIDQTNTTEKHNQIRQMDIIYQRAELCIIAAAGNDENAGLPGVGGSTRNPQPIASVNGIKIVSTMPHPHVAIKSSKWSTRGWTLQEAVLSRRHLVFTKDQVYFECHAMNYYETLPWCLDSLHLPEKSRFGDYLSCGHFSGIETYFEIGRDTPFDDFSPPYKTLVEEYTKRDLTYDADSLFAFHGIIQYITKRYEDARPICGIAFLAHPDNGHPMAVPSAMIRPFYWEHRYKSLNSNAKLPYRRKQHPSWSWAG